MFTLKSIVSLQMGPLQWSSSRGYPRLSLSLSATLDLVVWSTSLEAGVVIVPFERLRTWACVYVFGLSFFKVGLKDMTTQSAIKRLVSTVTDTPLLFTHCMSFF